MLRYFEDPAYSGSFRGLRRLAGQLKLLLLSLLFLAFSAGLLLRLEDASRHPPPGWPTGVPRPPTAPVRNAPTRRSLRFAPAGSVPAVASLTRRPRKDDR